LDLIADEPRFMPHLHLSLQHGDDMILKRMKRRHQRADALAFVANVRRLRPEMSFGADLIAGFPTETESMFENSMTMAKEMKLAHLHVFPFSPRPQTPAARMPQLDRSLVKERAALLRTLGDELQQAHLASMLGTVQHLLVERGEMAHTENFTRVATPGAQPGTRMTARIHDHNGTYLLLDQTAKNAA
jgi:threonylcarbamoyladenosine tRNA methylthiotransferase MtaB